MKNKYIYIIALLGCLFMGSCNDEWKDELFVKQVSFANSGVVNVHVKYSTKGGIIALKVPVLLSGSTPNDADINVTIALDSDTLTNLNFERFRYREDLYFRELPPALYDFKSMSTTIPKGSETGLLELNLKIEGLDLVNEYILPIKIISAIPYEVATRKYYKKSLMRIIPFNDYSGNYSVTGGVYDRSVSESGQTQLPVPSRNAKVVDEKTIFFYAGSIEEEAQDRAIYKVKAAFNSEDNTVTLTSDNPAINFSQQVGTYSVKKEMDEILPYLERTYTIVYLEYEYNDITNPTYPFEYRFKGTMTMERKRNILIPDEDQQEIF